MKNKLKVFILLFFWIFITIYADCKEEFKFFKNGREISGEEFFANGVSGKEIIFEDGLMMAEIGFKNGQQHGRYFEWYRNRQKKCEGKYLSGQKDGKWLEWYDDGAKKIKANFLMGSKHGQYLEWHANGQKKYLGDCFIGHKEGLWLRLDFEGTPIFEEWWKWGRLSEVEDLAHKTKIFFIYYPDGQKKYRKEFKGDLRHGKWCKWFINGKRSFELEYRKGMKHGTWTEYDTNGKIVYQEIWNEGRKCERVK